MPATEKTCVSCQHQIDSGARICPFCGADPETGKKMDVRPLIESHFPPPPELSPFERGTEFFRTHQTIAVALFVAIGVLALMGVHQWIQQRNRTAVAPTPGVTLTEIADLSRQIDEREEQPLPDLPFDGDGDPSRMRTFVLEPGAIAPPPEPVEGDQGQAQGSPAAGAAPGQQQPPPAAAPAPAQRPPQGPVQPATPGTNPAG